MVELQVFGLYVVWVTVLVGAFLTAQSEESAKANAGPERLQLASIVHRMKQKRARWCVLAFHSVLGGTVPSDRCQ